MKKIVLTVLCVTALFASCNGNKNEKSAEELMRDSLTQVINQKDMEMDEVLSSFNEIQEGFRAINEAEGRINVNRNNPEKSSKAEIAENFKFIQERLQTNRELIAKLRKQLKGKEAGASKLQATLEELTTQLEAKEAEILELRNTIEAQKNQIAEQGEAINTLSNNVNNLTAENQNQSNTINNQDKQLHTAWYVFGTKKELKHQNILKDGDVLKTGDFNKDYFTRIDIRTDKVIKLYSKSAKILTNHPAGSYTLEREADGQYTLKINSPKEFWNVSKYLVVVVK